VIRQIVATRTASGLRVSSPYGHRLTNQLKAAGARWDAAGRAWVVPDETAEPVLAGLREEYGSVDGNDWVTVDLRPVVEHDERTVRWGPWWLAAGANNSSPQVSGVAVVAGRLRTGGSRNNPTAIVRPDTTLRLQVPRDWFVGRGVATVDRGWAVTEVVTLVPDATESLPVSPVPAPKASPPAADLLSAMSDRALLSEMRSRAARAMDDVRRTPGREASEHLDKLGTLLSAIEALL
jgi:hypothetical protein